MGAILGNHIYPNLKYEKISQKLVEVIYKIITWLQMAVYRRQLNHRHHLQLRIPDINLDDMDAGDIKKAILENHDRKLFEEVEKSKKMGKNKHDDFSKVQDYMHGKALGDCRMAFRILCGLVKEVKGNCKDKHRRKGGEGFDM